MRAPVFRLNALYTVTFIAQPLCQPDNNLFRLWGWQQLSTAAGCVISVLGDAGQQQIAGLGERNKCLLVAALIGVSFLRQFAVGAFNNMGRQAP